MAQGDKGLAPEERMVTVLFTDIAGFTSLAERLPAPETAAFLNEHFRLLATCVEAEEGTIDKFIGDSLMAFWGAPEAQPDHAARACRAARAMAAAIIADNRHRREQGLEPVRIRLGVHSGPAIVGNIGAPGRINYTIVGDAVNTAQRIEDIAKEHMAKEDEAIVLASEAVLQSTDASSAAQPMGRYTLRGRREATRSSGCSEVPMLAPQSLGPLAQMVGRRTVYSCPFHVPTTEGGDRPSHRFPEPW